MVRLVTANKPIVSEPHPPLNLPSPEVDAFRESMKQLLDMIMAFFEEEQRQVDAGILELENTLLGHDVQEDDTNTEHSPRPVPENFKRLRDSITTKCRVVRREFVKRRRKFLFCV